MSGAAEKQLVTIAAMADQFGLRFTETAGTFFGGVSGLPPVVWVQLDADGKVTSEGVCRLAERSVEEVETKTADTVGPVLHPAGGSGSRHA